MTRKQPAARREYGREPKHRFILNPHPDVRCSRCPQGAALTKLRKVPLLIHIEPQNLITLRKTVKLCPACDILVVHQDELERELAFAFHERQPEIPGKPYLVLGTVEVADWKQGMREPVAPREMIARHHPFKEQLELRVSPGGWFPVDQEPRSRPSRGAGVRRPAGSPRRRSRPSTVYRLKITLEGIQPRIWRRVAVPADIPLSQLHHVIQIAMGWTDSHLHAFEIGGVEYTMPYEELDGELDMEDERRVRLSSLAPEAGARFSYQYDFGDDWQHTLLVEEILPADPESHYPLCLAGKRACPPEDCGGTWGYRNLLKVLKNPKHPEHEEMRTWVGPRYDPEAFDPIEINRKLQEARR